MNYDRGLRLWNATPDHLSDEERLAHVNGVLTMIETGHPPTERACFLCGTVGILLVGHKVCLDCHRPDACRICKEADYVRPVARISPAAVQGFGSNGRRRRSRGSSGTVDS